MLIKLGESIIVAESDVKSYDSVIGDKDILDRFSKFASELKSIAPKAKDFLYFSAIIMHAAERSSINDDGSIKIGKDGQPVKVGWDRSNDTWKWTSSDPSIMPYANSNRDIFPESELITAHKLWVGKPLCLDHKSSSVDFIRGVIVDTYYDKPLKRVIALVALDKVNYPDLARKVSTGYAASVSMGTAVKVAICTDCGAKASVESDFCHHMRSRSCYGEINTGLTPIELSIVVNGADPHAKIRHIVASANAIASYVETKKVALEQISKGESSSENLSELKKDIDSVSERIANLQIEAKTHSHKRCNCENAKCTDHEAGECKVSAGKQRAMYVGALCDGCAKDTPKEYLLDLNKADAPYGMSSGTLNMAETDLPATSQNISGTTDLSATAQIQNQLTSLHAEVQKIASTINNIKNTEDKMVKEKKAYFQGGGDVNEPTPGKPKYEVEPNGRDEEIKHNVGQAGTGPIDGIHPGYESFGESEEARKKRLQRMAESEVRAEKRAEALKKAKAGLEKSSYFQGGGDVNEPTPGKPKYNKEDAESIRTKDDIHMNGQKPFPEVGDVNGLHPSPESADQKDELKRKEMLARAALKAKFVKAHATDGTPDHANSRWDVYAGDKLILSATVDELSRKNAEVMYSGIATKDFGMQILNTIKTAGFNKAKSLYKGALDMGAPGALPMSPPDMGGPAAVPSMPEAVDGAEAADPSKRAAELAEKIRDTSSDLVEALDVLNGEGKELADVQELGATASDEGSIDSLQSMRKALNSALIEGITNTVEALQSHEEELNLVAKIYNTGKISKASAEDKSAVESLTEDAINHAEQAVAEAFTLLSSFVKYARGTEELVNRMTSEAQVVPPPASTTDVKPAPVVDPAEELRQEALKNMSAPVNPIDEEKLMNKLENIGTDSHKADDSDKEDTNEVNVDLNADQMKKVLETKASTPDLSTKEGRAIHRAKLAQKGVEWSDMIQKAHPKGGTTLEGLTMKPSEGHGAVETITEVHEKMLDVANTPVKVKKAAEDIQRAIVAGKIGPNDVEGLVAAGLDADAAKYWKSFYGQSPDGGSEFAASLIKEHAKAKADEELSTYKVKIARAYELAYDMSNRGMLSSDASSIKTQVEEIMSFDDKGFESLKKVVARYAPPALTKSASIPQVGLIGGEVIMPAVGESIGSLQTELEKVFSNKRY